MPSFKPKPTKNIKVSKKYTTTLDNKHQHFIDEFARDECETIPALKKELRRITALKQEDSNIDNLLEYSDRIKEINQQIKCLKQKKNNYFLDNAKYIFEYFENKKNINESPITATSSSSSSSKPQLLFELFKIKQFDNDNDSNNNNNKQQSFQKTQTIVQKYLSNIDDLFLDASKYTIDIGICQQCFTGEMIPLEDEGILLCNNCAVSIPYLVDNEKPSYKEPPKEVCFYAYKKINHFNEILAQFQGKETTKIPEHVLEQIQQQIKKERLRLDQLTYYKMKDILKNLGFNKYYEHNAFIRNKFGIEPPIFSPELEEMLRNLFMKIQSPYAKHFPTHRINFLNYYYVLFKLCELLGETKYLKDIPLLKEREKLIEQDETWKKMCIELDWEFISTV